MSSSVATGTPEQYYMDKMVMVAHSMLGEEEEWEIPAKLNASANQSTAQAAYKKIVDTEKPDETLRKRPLNLHNKFLPEYYTHSSLKTFIALMHQECIKESVDVVCHGNVIKKFLNDYYKEIENATLTKKYIKHNVFSFQVDYQLSNTKMKPAEKISRAKLYEKLIIEKVLREKKIKLNNLNDLFKEEEEEKEEEEGEEGEGEGEEEGEEGENYNNIIKDIKILYNKINNSELNLQSDPTNLNTKQDLENYANQLHETIFDAVLKPLTVYRHAYSISNLAQSNGLINKLVNTQKDAKLTLYGVLTTLALLPVRTVPLNEKKVFVSPLIRTWMTAICLFCGHVATTPATDAATGTTDAAGTDSATDSVTDATGATTGATLRLIVSPFLVESAFFHDVSNDPNPFRDQVYTIRVFIDFLKTKLLPFLILEQKSMSPENSQRDFVDKAIEKLEIISNIKIVIEYDLKAYEISEPPVKNNIDQKTSVALAKQPKNYFDDMNLHAFFLDNMFLFRGIPEPSKHSLHWLNRECEASSVNQFIDFSLCKAGEDTEDERGKEKQLYALKVVRDAMQKSTTFSMFSEPYMLEKKSGGASGAIVFKCTNNLDNKQYILKIQKKTNYRSLKELVTLGMIREYGKEAGLQNNQDIQLPALVDAGFLDTYVEDEKKNKKINWTKPFFTLQTYLGDEFLSLENYFFLEVINEKNKKQAERLGMNVEQIAENASNKSIFSTDSFATDKSFHENMTMLSEGQTEQGLFYRFLSGIVWKNPDNVTGFVQKYLKALDMMYQIFYPYDFQHYDLHTDNILLHFENANTKFKENVLTESSKVPAVTKINEVERYLATNLQLEALAFIDFDLVDSTLFNMLQKSLNKDKKNGKVSNLYFRNVELLGKKNYPPPSKIRNLLLNCIFFYRKGEVRPLIKEPLGFLSKYTGFYISSFFRLNIFTDYIKMVSNRDLSNLLCYIFAMDLARFKYENFDYLKGDDKTCSTVALTTKDTQTDCTEVLTMYKTIIEGIQTAYLRSNNLPSMNFFEYENFSQVMYQIFSGFSINKLCMFFGLPNYYSYQRNNTRGRGFFSSVRNMNEHKSVTGVNYKLSQKRKPVSKFADSTASADDAIRGGRRKTKKIRNPRIQNQTPL